MPDPILQYQFFDKDGKAHTIDKQEYDAHSQEFAEQFPEAQMRMVDPDGQSWNIPVSNVGAAMKEGGYRMWRMKVPVKSPERKPSAMPEGFGNLDTRQADKALTGQGRVDWEQKEPEQPDTSARQLTKALKGDKEAARNIGLDAAGKRMQEEYAYMEATGKPLENIVNTPVTAPTAEVDEDGQMLMGQTTDEQRVAQYQQAEKEKARKRLVADAVDRLQSQMEKGAAEEFKQSIKGSVNKPLNNDIDTGMMLAQYNYGNADSPEELLRRLNEAYGYEDQEEREARDEELRKQGKSTVLAHWDDKQKNLDFANRFLEDNREAIEETASRLNMSVDDYVLDELVPSLAGEIAERYGKNMSEKYSVKDTADFLAREMGNSIIGTLATMGSTTKKARQFMQEELQKSREGKGEHYNSNFGTNLAGETLMFAADAVPLMIGGTIGSYTAEGVGKAISALGKKELGALVASGSPFLAANVGKAVKYGGMAAGAMARGIGSMAPFMAASGAVHDMSTGDGTLSSIGKAALEGAWEGAKFGAATGAFSVGSGAAMSKLSGAAKRAALMGASFLVENQIFTGLDYISDPDNFNWAESAENAFYMQLASKFSSAHGVKGVVSKFKSLFTPKAGAPVRLTDTDKENIQRAFAGEDFETIASDVNNIGKILSDKQVIPWTTRMKVAAQTMNTSEPSRPRTSTISITPSKELVERAADGELIEVHKFDTPEQMAEIRQMIEERQANDDMMADFGKLSTMQAQEVTPDIIRLASDEVLQLSPEIRPEDVQPGGKSYDLVLDRAKEIANPANEVLGQFARDYDMTVGEVRGIMEKRPIERTDEETDLMNELSVRLHEAAYPKGEPHPTQSRIDGESLAGDEPAINPETSTMVAQELEESRQAYLDALGKNEDISSAVRQLEAQGARLDDIYMYVRENFSGPDADRVLESIADYANAQAKQEGYIEKTGSNIDETVNQDIIEKSFHGTIDDAPDEDHIITINRDGESLILINGNIGTRDGVAVDPGKSGGMVIARTEDGRWVSLRPDALMTITERVPKDEYGNGIREQMQLDATRTAVETGLVKPETEQPAEKMEETEADGEAGITNDTGADEPPASPLSRIPVVKDESGQPVLDEEGDAQYQFDKAPLEDTLAALDEISGGDKATVSSIVDDMLEQSAKEVEKASKLTPKGKDPIKIARSASEIKEQQAEAQRKLDYWTEAKQVLENANKPESELNNQPEVNNETGKSVALQPKAATPTVEEQKQQRIAEAKEQYGDLFDDDFTKANDVYELASMWVGRKRNLAWEDVNGKRGLQKELGWTRRIGGDTKYIETLLAKNGEGVGIDEFAHMVWESPENDVEGEKRFTSEEIKDAILELLKSAQSKSDVVDYALNTRIEQAKRYLEEQKAAEKEAIENKEVEPVTLTDEEKQNMDDMLPFPKETDEMPEPIDVPDKPIDEKEVQSPDLKETYKEVSDEIKTRRLRVITSEEDVKTLEDAGVGNEIIGRIKADLEDPEVTGRYVPELGEVLLYDDHIRNLGLDKDEQRGVIYHEHIHGLEREGFTKEDFADTARLIEEANKEFAEAVREDHKDKDKDVQDEEILGYLIQDIIRKGYKDALFDGTLDVGSEELNKRLYEIGKLLRGIKDGREREKESEVSVADEGGSRPDDQERLDEAPIEDTEAQETGRDEYLKPRNEKEEKIISDVEAKLAEDIKAKEEEVRKAKADLEKAKARESDKATDIFANDETFREEDQIFSSEEMGLDTSVEGVEKRTKAERDALAAAEQELDRLRSQAEHDARIRGALDNERRQTTFDSTEEYVKSIIDKSDEQLQQLKKKKEDAVGGDLTKLENDPEYNSIRGIIKQREIDQGRRDAWTFINSAIDDNDITFVDKATPEEIGELNHLIDKYGVDDSEGKIEDYVNRLREKYPVDEKGSNVNPIEAIEKAAKEFNEEKKEKQKELGITTDETPEQVAETEGEAMLVDEPLLTEGDIDSTSLSSVQKTWAKAYLKGRTDNELYLEAYLEAKEDVRNRRQDNEGGSPDADGTQLAGTPDNTERGSGRSGESAIGMADGTDVPEKGNEVTEQGGVSGVEDRPVNLSVTPGERGNSGVPEQKPEVDRLSAGGEQPVGGSGARSDGSAVRPDGAGQRGSGVARQDGERDIKTRRADLKNKRDELLAKLRELKSKEKESGRLQMAVLPPIPSGISSFIPKDKEQRKVFWELATTTADYGYTYLEEGLTKFKEWKEKVIEDFVEPIRDFFGWGQNEVDRYIEQVWASDYEINGVTRTMAEWASFLEPKKLKGYVAKDIKSKYEAQQAAESVETKVGDIDNIRESLPYLLPEQHNDVLKAEQQFFSEKHQDREHAYGKGMMFTNGTGTGKTYTGLGIVKRFVKQGKGRVLILTPSQEKVNDWRMDGQNLGLDLESLDEEAKVKGTSATKAKGKGVVVTTYANARQNLKMLEDCFDLIVYDESHKIMESKEASATTMADFHEMLTNKNVERSIDRQTYWLPEWIEYRDLTREVEDIRGQLDKLDNDGSQEAIDTRIRLNARMTEIQNRFEELRPIMTEIRESKRPQAEIDSKRTKVVFLSATPFNVRESLRYAEGYLFSYPEEDKNTIGSYNHRSPEDMFMEQMFPAGYRWRYGRLENHVSNAEALGRQEVQFSDYLQNTLRTVSGRMIASDYDYSRDFPIMTLDHAGRFNQAMSEVYRNKKYNKLSEAFRKCFDYNYSTALFEAMKTSLVNERIKEHLKRGQKVVVFHRRRTSGDLEPPFRRALNYAEELAEKDQNPKTKSELLSAVKAFETDFADMLEWEKTLDYTLPREQIEKVFGSDKVAFFSGAESKKTKHKSVEEFMKDNGGKDIIVIQEASGKEGISLHDQTGEHQRVEINLALPQSPIAFIQIEGRIYRIGNMSNAIFEYPLLGLDLETSLFAQRFNSALGTTENLALGSQARNLRKSIAESVLMNTGEVDYDHQGLGGKDMDGRVADPGDKDGFDIAIQDYYGNQKIGRGRDNREGVDYFPTPEPIGYKMVEFGQMLEGETALEPSAGHGAIARYVPETNGLTAVEPSASLFTKLQMRAGGPGRRFEEMTFEEYPLANKHDVILMNPPYGTSGVTAMEHVAKAFRHLNEGGRIVAIIPNGPAMDKRMNAWLESKDLNGSAVVTGEMILPNIAFGRAGTNVWTRMVVIDKVTRPEMRKNMPEKIGYDFSRETDINELFERIRNTRMPERTIDQVAINEKRVRRTEKQLSDNPFVTSTFIGTDYMDKPIISVTTRSSDRSLGIRFSLSNYSMDDVLDTYKTVKEYGEDPDSVDWGKWKNREFGRGKDKVKATDAIRDYCDTAIKTIENLTRMTSDQLDKALTEREEERARKRKEQEEKWKREQAEREARAEEERRQRIAKRDAAKEALKENFSGDDLETLGHMIDLAHQEIFGARRYREMLKNRGVDWETGKKITTPRVVLRESYNEKMPLDLGTMETLMDIAETSIDSRRKDAAKRALEMSGIHSDTGEEKENFDYSSHDEYYEKELRDFLEKASFTVKLKTKAQKAEEAEVYKRLEAEAKANTDERQNRSDYEYALDKNTRTGDDMHLVKYNGARLGSEDYKAVERKAKANGGYYNRFKKAWHFPTEEDARKFVDGMTNVTNNTDNGAVRFSEVKDEDKDNVFFSNALYAAGNITQEKATPEQWLKMIEKQGGLKSGEDKWIGLSDWLKGQDKKSLTKQEVMDYIRQNEIHVEDVSYADDLVRTQVALEKKYPGIIDVFDIEPDGYDGFEVSIKDRQKAIEMFNKHNKDDEIDPDNIGKYDLEMITEWVSDLYSMTPPDGNEKGINSTRMDYTTNGLRNKREIALTVPTIEPYNDQDSIHFGDAGRGRAVAWVRFGDTYRYNDSKEYTEARRGLKELEEKYNGQLYRNPDMTPEDEALRDKLVRQSMDNTPNRSKVLVIDEIQSKRHQEGREKGYYTKEYASELEKLTKEERKAKKAVDDYYDKLMLKYDVLEGEPKETRVARKESEEAANSEEREELNRLKEEHMEAMSKKDNFVAENGSLRTLIPEAPFEKNWHELAMKRMLRYAAENGYDKIAWTKGEQQAERYNIGNVVNEIRWKNDAYYNSTNGVIKTKEVVLKLPGGDSIHLFVNPNGVVEYGTSEYKGKNLSEVLGKELSNKIMNDEGEYNVSENNKAAQYYTLSGDGLRIGGEGMKGFYDEILPRFMNKYGKKWGVQVGEVELPHLEESAQKMWSVDVTPDMKASVMQGQPMFRERASERLGQKEDGRILKDAESLSKKLNVPFNVANDPSEVKNKEAAEAIRSGRKIQGWYDTKTGEVTLYLPNIKNTYDGEKVISHEIIGHKGMRDLLGENGYKSYMRSLLFDLKDKDLSEYLAKNLSRNGFDIYRTVDEFLAEAAERGYGDLPMWQKVKEKLTDALRSIGFTMSPSISDVKYMVWLSKHNLERGNIMNKVERDALLYKLGRERYSANVKDGEYTYNERPSDDVPYFPGNGETLFRQTPSIKNQRQNYERALKRLGYVWKEAHIDAMQSAVELMRSISGIKKIEDIPSAENFVLLENQMSSKEEQMDYLFNRDYMEPLDKAVSDILPDMGRNIDDQLRNLQLYMIKKHGLERNRVLFVRDAIRALRKDSAADQNQVDQLEADYNKTVGILRDDLRLGVTDLKDYFEDMDDWIRANIDPDYKPGEKDYSGLTDLYGEGYDEAQVLDDVMSTESMLGEDRVKNLWDKTKAVSQFGLDMEYEGGLDSRERHDKVSDMFEWYVPLRGYNEKSAEEVYDYLEENGGGRKWAGPVLANAKGRESLADVDVFATLGAMSSSAINRALRNQMKQAFARFVRNHYNEVDADKRLVTELPYLWAEKQTTAGNEEWVEKFPDIPEGASADDIADILERYNQDMQILESQGLAKRVRQSANLPFRPAKAENKAQHIVDVWINGEKHPFVINGNPRAAQAINGQLKGERKGNLLWLSDLSHFMAKMNTSYSPDFIMRNTERDLFFSAANIAVKENFKYWKNWAKNYAVATGRVAAGVPGMETNLFNRYRNDNLDMSNQTDRYFKEFMENGGETGFVEQKNLDKWKKIVKEGVKKDSKPAEVGKKIINALPDVIEAMNERAENLARFATYMTSRQMGRTITRSVSDAKEVSVNFNRKGSGSKVVGMNKGTSNRQKWVTSANDYLAGWSAQNLQDYLMFYNAGVQGINNMTKSVVNNPVKGAAAMAAFALAGMIMPRLNQFLYEEDDDKSGKEPENPYAELPEYVRRNNLCIYGNNGSFLTVALPIELRAFYGLGDMAASYISNPELRSTRNAGVDILAQLSQIMPVNFLEGGDFSLWNLSPSGAAPLLEAARNENWLGQPIERGETPWNVYDPRWTRAFKNVSDVYVGASKRLNAATNPYNDENIKGWADGAITDPALVEHVVNGYFGGVGSTVNRVAQLAKHAGEMSPKDAITSNWMPIVRTQHFTPDERTRYARTRNKWYYYKEEAEKTSKVIKALEKRGKTDPLSFMKSISEEEGRKGTRANIMKEAEKRYKDAKLKMDAAEDLQQKNLYQLQMDQIMEQTVKELDKIK